jgi:hypothetical protein
MHFLDWADIATGPRNSNSSTRNRPTPASHRHSVPPSARLEQAHMEPTQHHSSRYPSWQNSLMPSSPRGPASPEPTLHRLTASSPTPLPLLALPSTPPAFITSTILVDQHPLRHGHRPRRPAPNPRQFSRADVRAVGPSSPWTPPSGPVAPREPASPAPTLHRLTASSPTPLPLLALPSTPPPFITSTILVDQHPLRHKHRPRRPAPTLVTRTKPSSGHPRRRTGSRAIDRIDTCLAYVGWPASDSSGNARSNRPTATSASSRASAAPMQ